MRDALETIEGHKKEEDRLRNIEQQLRAFRTDQDAKYTELEVKFGKQKAIIATHEKLFKFVEKETGLSRKQIQRGIAGVQAGLQPAQGSMTRARQAKSSKPLDPGLKYFHAPLMAAPSASASGMSDGIQLLRKWNLW